VHTGRALSSELYISSPHFLGAVGVAQLVKHLSSDYEALSSNSSTAKKKKITFLKCYGLKQIKNKTKTNKPKKVLRTEIRASHMVEKWSTTELCPKAQ
jgi:hypothetical protein